MGAEMSELDQQVLELIEHLVAEVEAGYGLCEALQSAGSKLKPPLAQEIATTMDQMQNGASIECALSQLVDRVGNDNLELVVRAIFVCMEEQGALANPLRFVSKLIRRGPCGTISQ